MKVVSAARAKESFMMYRLAAVIIPVLLLGCGPSSDEYRNDLVPAEHGFFPICRSLRMLLKFIGSARSLTVPLRDSIA